MIVRADELSRPVIDAENRDREIAETDMPGEHGSDDTS